MSKGEAFVFALIVALTAVACVIVIDDREGGKLEPSDVRSALRTLPYDFKLGRVKGPSGNTASFVGKANGPHNTTLEFSIGIGNPPSAIPVSGVGTKHVEWFDEMGFVFNDNGELVLKFKTTAQWREVARMAVDVEESLCKAATRKPCPI